MALVTGSKYGLMIYNNVADESPAPSLQQSFTISKSVGGFNLVITLDPARCLCPITMTHNGISYIKTVDHGQGIQSADNLIMDPSDATSWNAFSPTGQGSQEDGSNLRVGSSNSLARYIDADGAGYRHIQNPAYWLKPGEVLSPGHPARNPGLVSRMRRDTYMRIGAWSGATWATDQIITYQTTLTVPVDAQMQRHVGLVMCPLTVYSDSVSIFNQQEYVDASTGTASAYPGYPASSTTLCVMTSHSDGSKGIAAYVPRSQLSTEGFYQGYSTAAIYDSFVICRTPYPSGVPAGTYTQNCFIAWGTRAQCIAALQTIYANVG